MATKISVSQAKDKFGKLPGFYLIKVNGKPKVRIIGKRAAITTANTARKFVKRHGKLPIKLR